MPSAFTQTMPPTENIGHSRLTATIIALIALACVLAAAFIYLQNGESSRPVVVDQRVQAINQILAQLRTSAPASQTEIQAVASQVSASSMNMKVTQSQIDQVKSQLKGQ